MKKMSCRFKAANILLPQKDFERWAVVACDQFTAERDYWEETERIVGDAPSSLRVILPEVYLEDGDAEERIQTIHETMDRYMADGILEEHPDSMVYVERTQSDGKIRRGIVGSISLDDYDYHRGARTPIRATEQLMEDIIPSRIQIRKSAEFELPHALLLIDDPDGTVIEPLQTAAKEPAYSFDLMQGGGHLNGYFLPKEAQEKVQSALNALERKDGKQPFLLAVGDGIHSLAAARECYRIYPTADRREALVEIVNIHDPSIHFEPIYRVLLGVDGETLLEEFLRKHGAVGVSGKNAALLQRFTVVYGENEREIAVHPISKLPVGTLQAFIDDYQRSHPGVRIEYIHGKEAVRELCRQPNCVGFLFDPFTKEEVFNAVKTGGALPRKTYSIGQARDKRYYLEARKLKA